MLRPRRWVWALAGVAGLLLLVVTIAWALVCRRIEAGLPEVRAVLAANGWGLGSGAAGWRGWPLAATVRLPDAVLARAGGAWAWRAERLDVTLSPFEPGAVRIVPHGTMGLLVDGAPVAVEGGSVVLHAPLRPEEPMRLEVRGVALRHEGDRVVRVATLDARFDAVAVEAAAEGVSFEPAFAAPFDGAAGGTLRAVLTRPAGLSAAAWQAAGGRVQVPELTLRWGGVAASGSAEGGLDAALQPEGRARVQVQGGPAALEAAAASGLLLPAQANAARAVLTVLALGSRREGLDLPVVLRDRALSVAQFPVLRLPPVVWE